MPSNLLFDGLLANVEPNDVFARSADGTTEILYRDVLKMSAQYANLLTSFGVKKGDRVAVQAPKSLEMVMLYLGAVRAGAVFLPLNTAYVESEIDYFLSDAEPALFVSDPCRVSNGGTNSQISLPRVETLGDDQSASTMRDARASMSGEFENVSSDSDDLAAILYTSGTTGRSKGAMLTHGNLLSNAETLSSLWQFSSADTLLHALPIFHTHGLFVACNVTLFSGASLVFMPKFDLDAIFAAMPDASVLMGVPTFYTRLLSDARLNRDITQDMRLFVSGSAPLLAETHTDFEQRTGHRILERYGMTETNMITSNPFDGDRRPGTVGQPLPGVEVVVTYAKDGARLPEGEIGTIEVRGPNVFQGYWRMPEKTAEELKSNGFFITGDLGVFDRDGYLSIVGREKDLIISGGYNIYPKEVETAIDEHPGVLESAVIGIPDEDFGEAVVACIVRSSKESVTEGDIQSFLRPKLARFKQPRHIHFLYELPRNTLGKVQKVELRKTYAEAVD